PPGAHRAPHADLTSAFENARKHDVHDPDAAHQQRDSGDATHHDVEDSLSLLILFEQFARHDYREVLGLAVHAGEDLVDQHRTRLQRVRALYADDDFVEFGFHPLQLELLKRRRQWNVYVIAEVLYFDSLEFILGKIVVFEYAYHREPHFIYLD